ncbi:MAG: DUF2306 domain-containing protein [Segetibacter sp.]|nr:DUF2306 domain-containing protein [Segetibacter sp.]
MTFYFIVAHIVGYATNGIPEYFGATLMNAKVWFYLHMTGGATAILLGPLQFWKAFRIKYIQLHRTLGKIYIIGSIISVICLIRILPEGGCTACKPSQTVVFTLWLLTTVAAWWTIKRKNIKAHRQFMARSYLFAFHFVAVRMLDYLGLRFFGFTHEDNVWLANGDWFTWVVPFIILEMYQSWWPVAKINYAAKGNSS